MVPIREVIKKNVTTKDIISPIIDNVASIPYTPAAIFLFILSPTDAGDPYLDEYMTAPRMPLPNDYNPYDINLIEREPVLIENHCEE